MTNTLERLSAACAYLLLFLLFVPLAHADFSAYLGALDTMWGTLDIQTGVFTPTGSSEVLLAGLGVYIGNLYGGLDAGGTLYKVDPNTGHLTVVGTGSIVYNDFGSTPAGLFGYSTTGYLYAVDPNTGATTLLGPSAQNGSVISMSSGQGDLYFTADYGQGSILYKLNTTNGSATPIGNTGVSRIGAMVWIDGILYAGTEASPYSIYRLDTNTGQGTFVMQISGLSSPIWGLAPVETVMLSPPSLDFGAQSVDSLIAPQASTLTNTGAGALFINNITVTGTNSGDFSESDNCPLEPASLAPGDSCQITVTFSPTGVGTRTASITTNDNAVNSPQMINLTGVGVGGKVALR